MLHSRHEVQAGILVLLCATLVGCIGATPLPKRTRTPEGTEIKSVDLTFIHPGQTTRGEVKDKLKLIDTGYEGDHFFLGRWTSSTWGGWYLVAGTCCSAAAGGGRVWKTGNLLVEFDDAGSVMRSEPFSDSKAIQMLTPVAQQTHLQLNEPVEIPVRYMKVGRGRVDAKIVLLPERFEFEELGDQKKKHKFSLLPGEVLKVESPATMREVDPTYSGYRLHCAHDLKKIGGPRGKDINVEVTLPQLVTLMSYFMQVQAAATAGTTDRRQ